MNRNIVAVVLMVMLSTACSRDVKQALEKAKAEVNPAKSLEIVRQAEIPYFKVCDRWRCDVPEELEAAERDYFVKAAKAGDEGVLRELFVEREDMSDLRSELKSSVLDRAKESKNRDLLIAAAKIAGDDTLGIVDKAQQIDFLKRAWSVGDVKSAGKLAHIYVRLKDFDNAYFWSLRCIQECKRFDGVMSGEKSNQIELLELEKHLDAKKIAKLQSESAMPASTN